MYDVIQITNPSFTLGTYDYVQYQSNDNYCNIHKCDGKNQERLQKYASQAM